MSLKYLYTVTYLDGSEYQQNPEDKSVSDEKRSCFFDIDQDKVALFTLKGDGHEYSVNLVDGVFSVDGVPFQMHEEELYGFRLIFWRNHTHSFNVGAEKSEETSHETVYRMGWQCTVDGTNHQRVMQIK